MLGGTVGSWTHTTQTVNAPAGGPYLTTNNFAWNAGETNSPTESVTSTDNAGNTSAASVLTFSNDSTNPTGAITAPASSANVRGSAVTVSSNSADGGSGVASAQFQRSPAGAGIWTTIGAADTTSPYSVNWDTTAVADGLYDLRVITTDNVGNTFTSALVTNVRVDNTLPTNALTIASSSPAGAAFLNGTTVYYRGTAAGNLQLQNAVADGGSGPDSATFPALGGTVGTWTHTTQTVNAPAGGPYVTTNNFAWNAGDCRQPLRTRVTTTDNAGNTTTATVTHLHASTTTQPDRLDHGACFERERARQRRHRHLQLGRRRLRRRLRPVPALPRRRRRLDEHRRRRHDQPLLGHLGHHRRCGRALRPARDHHRQRRQHLHLAPSSPTSASTTPCRPTHSACSRPALPAPPSRTATRSTTAAQQPATSSCKTPSPTPAPAPPPRSSPPSAAPSAAGHTPPRP